MELHEVVTTASTSVMQLAVGGFPVPANGSLKLQPGGYHLMLMGVTSPIKAGQTVTFTLTCANGATTSFTAQAKDFTGAEEQYKPSTGGAMPSMSASH